MADEAYIDEAGGRSVALRTSVAAVLTVVLSLPPAAASYAWLDERPPSTADSSSPEFVAAIISRTEQYVQNYPSGSSLNEQGAYTRNYLLDIVTLTEGLGGLDLDFYPDLTVKTHYDVQAGPLYIKVNGVGPDYPFIGYWIGRECRSQCS